MNMEHAFFLEGPGSINLEIYVPRGTMVMVGDFINHVEDDRCTFYVVTKRLVEVRNQDKWNPRARAHCILREIQDPLL